MGALSGIRVVDLTSMVSGPVAATILADQGAEVVKVEPLRGEQMRYLGPSDQGTPPTFFSCSRGKQFGKSIPNVAVRSVNRPFLSKCSSTASRRLLQSNEGRSL